MEDTISLNHERLRLLPRILRSALHEFNQSLTAFNFTASNLQLLANETLGQQQTLCRELTSISEQLVMAEQRYRDTLAILDWLTLEVSTLKKINLNTFVSDVLRLSASKFRKVNCQVHFSPSEESIHVVCSISVFTYLLFLILFSIADATEKSQRKSKSASWKLIVTTEFRPTKAHLSFSFPFGDASFSCLKKWLSTLHAEMEVQKMRKGMTLHIRLPLNSGTNEV